MEKKERFTLQGGMHFHLVGIGGSGISAIAWVLLGRGFKVSGSDEQSNAITAALQKAGATVYKGHETTNVAGADALIISSAVPVANPEVQAAQRQGIPVLKRVDFLGHLMDGSKGIAVAGSHGKTTTTGMIAQIFMDAELDPTVIVGGMLPSLESNGRHGAGRHFIIEADEYDYMFLGLKPAVAVITSIEHDHPDMFPTMTDYLAAFRSFVELLPEDGHLVACVDDPGVVRLLAELALPDSVRITTYSVAEDSKETAAFRAVDLRANALGGTDFLVENNGEIAGLARLRVPGNHNVGNALAAIIVGLDAGIPFNTICRGLAKFGGMSRRFQVTGEVGNVTIIDDYAHHPTEIRATLAAARQRYPGRRLWAIWQPHTYSRTRLLLEEFATSFRDADRVVALDIYGSREKDTLGIDTAAVLKAMKDSKAVHVPDRAGAARYLLDRVRPGDVVLTLGAGDGNVVGQWLLEGLQKRVQNTSGAR